MTSFIFNPNEDSALKRYLHKLEQEEKHKV